jgi:AcrR family transcriptional regulator
MSDSRNPDTRERMMFATLRVLDEHGYAGLSIQRIADEADLSKSSFYHFFDGKDDLLLAFLDFMVEQFQKPLNESFGDDAVSDLWTHLDFALSGVTGDVTPPVDGFDPGSGKPYVEVRSQAVHDDDYRARFTDIDDTMKARLQTIIDNGIEDGVFRDVDPDATAELVLTLMMGALFRRATADAIDTDAVRDELETVLETHLYTDD